jgi:hypothetical protein
MAAVSEGAMARVMPPWILTCWSALMVRTGGLLRCASNPGRLFKLEDGQLVALARLMCCGDYAKTLASQLEEGMDWAAFKTSFHKEFCEENVDRLQFELLNLKQETSVGEYAVRLQRILAVVPLPIKEQIRCFMRGLKHQQVLWLAFAADPKTLEEAIEAAKRAEAAYVPVHHGEVSELVERPTAQMTTEFKHPGMSQLKPLYPLTRFHGNSTCPRCLQEGHFLKGCTRAPKAKWFSCCRYWGKHRRSCKEGRLMKTP